MPCRNLELEPKCSILTQNKYSWAVFFSGATSRTGSCSTHATSFKAPVPGRKQNHALPSAAPGPWQNLFGSRGGASSPHNTRQLKHPRHDEQKELWEVLRIISWPNKTLGQKLSHLWTTDSPAFTGITNQPTTPMPRPGRTLTQKNLIGDFCDRHIKHTLRTCLPVKPLLT